MFSSTDGVVETEKVTELKEGGTYSQGNHETLMKFLSKLTGKEEPKVEHANWMFTYSVDACIVFPYSNNTYPSQPPLNFNYNLSTAKAIDKFEKFRFRLVRTF